MCWQSNVQYIGRLRHCAHGGLIGAKYEGMAKRVQKTRASYRVQPPAYPYSGTNIFGRLRAALTEAFR